AGGAHAAARIVSADALAPRNSVRRVSPPPLRTQRPSPSTTGVPSPQLGAPQSAGAQCDGGFAVSSGLTILPLMAALPNVSDLRVVERADRLELLPEIGDQLRLRRPRHGYQRDQPLRR